MFKTSPLAFSQTATLPPLLLNYLQQNKKTEAFYDFFPDEKGFSALLKTAPYKNFDHQQLSQILLKQSRQVENTSEQTLSNLQLLGQKNTFTITTGHQLCLFTGPLYFAYKIISTVNLARDLKQRFPEHNFVPVYWMASEDHDFEEVASFHVNGQTLTWQSGQKGAVGDFNTQELRALLPQLKEALGISASSKYLLELFEKAYLKHDTLALATRYLVNELFGHYGLVCLDGNDADFKKQLKDVLRKDIFENRPYTLVSQSIKALEAQGYPAQVNPRPINCFFMDTQLRARIEKKGDAFELVGANRAFTKAELEAIIETEPERLSPNVVLRPVYQQLILPNIAYLGGPGELAYWLEFKAMFDDLQVFFPVLMPRNFISVIDKPTQTKIKKLGFSTADFFKPEEELIKEHLVHINAVFAMEAETRQVADLYTDLEKRVVAIDPTLSKHLLATKQRALHQLESISQKATRALKKKSEAQIRQIEHVKQALFPKSVPQERYENFASQYLKYGPGFFAAVEQSIDPFALNHKLLEEE